MALLGSLWVGCVPFVPCLVGFLAGRIDCVAVLLFDLVVDSSEVQVSHSALVLYASSLFLPKVSGRLHFFAASFLPAKFWLLNHVLVTIKVFL